MTIAMDVSASTKKHFVIYSRWLLAFARRTGEISHETRAGHARNAASWEKFDDEIPEAGTFSGLVGRDEKRAVIQARHDGGGFNLACT